MHRLMCLLGRTCNKVHYVYLTVYVYCLANRGFHGSVNSDGLDQPVHLRILVVDCSIWNDPVSEQRKSCNKVHYVYFTAYVYC